MKRSVGESKDFFARYHHQKISLFLSAFFLAGILSFGFVSLMKGGIDTRGLMANVSQLTEQKSGADLILSESPTGFVVTFGSYAEHVDGISFTLMTDPTRVASLASTDMAVTSTEPGVYRLHKTLTDSHLKSGDTIAHIIVDGQKNTPVTLADAEFESNGVRYALTSGTVK